MTRKRQSNRQELKLGSKNIHQSGSAFRYGRKALELLWATSHSLTIALAILISFMVFGTAFIISKGTNSLFVKSVFVISIGYSFFLITKLFTRLRV